VLCSIPVRHKAAIHIGEELLAMPPATAIRRLQQSARVMAVMDSRFIPVVCGSSVRHDADVAGLKIG